MKVVASDLIAPPDDSGIGVSSIDKLLAITAGIDWAAERQHYALVDRSFLFPFSWLHMNPASTDPSLPPEEQDDKTDFVKQNVVDFHLGDTAFARGWIHPGSSEDETEHEPELQPFLKISYRGGPDSALSAAARHHLGQAIILCIELFDQQETILVPYNSDSHRYEVELWGCDARRVEGRLGPKAIAAIEIGAIQFKPNIIRGCHDIFRRDSLAGHSALTIFPDSIIHPLRPLKITYSWIDPDETGRDPQEGDSNVAVFDPVIRGWTAFERAGTSLNTHGGVGCVRYSNLLTNYRKGQAPDLTRALEPWMFNAFGEKTGKRSEPFFAVNYVDMHVIEPQASIGIHRHRDNHEALFVISGSGVLISGDWCQYPDRQRAFQVQSLRQGDMSMVANGGLHGFKNLSDGQTQLLMFGGYD